MSDKPTASIGSKIPGGIVLHVMKRLDPDASSVAAGTANLKDMGLIELAGFTPPRQESLTVADKEMADVWFAENADHPMVKNGLVFFQEPAEPQQAEAPEEQPKGESEPAAEAAESRPEPEIEPEMEQDHAQSGDEAADRPSGFAAVAPPLPHDDHSEN